MNCETPLLDMLLEHIRLRPVSFHMPGHKGRPMGWEALADIAALDVTELPDTGDLYAGGDPIAAAEALWADAWDMPWCQFLTGGSTQGNYAALLLAARRGRNILVDRLSHRSVYHAMALWDMKPTYLMRDQSEPLDPEEVHAALTAAEDWGEPIETVCITSPTYYGVLSDIRKIARVAHAHGAILVVDAAHGCHLPFLGENPFRWADLVVSSAHKTLPVLGQGAVLMGGAQYPAEDLRWAAAAVGTSSPSYPILASLDYARSWMESEAGRGRWEETREQLRTFRGEFPFLKGTNLDPWRLVLTVNAAKVDGFQVRERLDAMGVFCEMADRDHVVFLCGGKNTPEDFERLWTELQGVEMDWPGLWGRPLETPLQPIPEPVLSLRDTLFAPRERAELAASEGRVAAEGVSPYPPGSPLIAPGERITKKCLAYLREVGYNVHSPVDIVK